MKYFTGMETLYLGICLNIISEIQDVKKIFNILTAFFWAAAASNAFCNPFVCVERRLLPSTLDRDSLNPNSSPTVNPVKIY